MHLQLPLAALLAVASLVVAAPSPAGAKEKRVLKSTSGNETIITELLDAPTGRDRIGILTNDKDFVFNFLHPARTDIGIAKGLGTSNRV